ncbi:MAG: conserved rane protein of unknown function [Candidatus Berkelbacteria bacterium]|nr:conserved rane protein of unknown function [Candidatus Berkelbacteria bacterium]
MKDFFVNLVGKANAALVPSNIPVLDPLKTGNLPSILVGLLNIFLWVAGLLAVVYLVYGGVLYITAGGDAEKATKGRTALINAVIGIIIVLLAVVILNYVISVTK